MNSIYKAFENKKAFVGFLVAGDPNEYKTVDYILEMEKAGADLIEIGIPFSDPADEGETIQNANIRALNRKITMDKVFKIVKSVREYSNIPIVFLTYINPAYRYGYNKFFEDCREVGVGGVIFSDVPFEEKQEVEDISNKYDVDIISIIAPTSKNRIEKISKEAKGFIYILPSFGEKDEIPSYVRKTVQEIKKFADIPCVFNFEINDIDKLREIREVVDGIVIRSDIVKIIEKYGDNSEEYLFNYVKKIKQAIE